MKVTKTVVPVVLAFTPNYFIPACTTILSILQQAGSAKFHFICLLSEPLTERMKEKLMRIEKQTAIFSFINLKGQLQDIYIDERYTVAASYRLLLPHLLPAYDKVIYIDCDIVVRQDLAALFMSLPLTQDYIAGVFEVTLDFQVEYINSIGCNPNKYVNSGFLMMNLKLMREDKLLDQFMEAARAPYLQFPDQDVLNKVCQGKILGLKAVHNSIRTFFLPQYKSRFLEVYSEQELIDVYRTGNIHYTGTKPWEAFTIRFVNWWRVYWTLPKEIKQEWRVNNKLNYLAMFLNTRMGSLGLKGVQSIYRRIKYAR